MSGLEVIGAIASVGQLAGTVFAISKQLYEIADALSKAPSDIKDLADDLKLFHGQLLLHAELVSAENARYSNQIIRLTVEIIDRCANICVKINNILRKLRSYSLWAKIKWIYKEKEIARLLRRLGDLKLSLMAVSAQLISAKTDYVLDALRVTRPSVFENPEDEEQSQKTIADIEKITQKLANIQVGETAPLNIANLSRSVSVVSATKARNGMRSSPKSLGWTHVENKLKLYQFVVPDNDEPYLEMLLGTSGTFNTPETVYLDKHSEPSEGVYPCMYPGGCKGNHNFFQAADLRRHYRIAHAGISHSRDILAESGNPGVILDNITSNGPTPQNVGNTPHPSFSSTSNVNLTTMPMSKSMIQVNNLTTMVSPQPTRLTHHALGSMQSFHSAVSRQPSPHEARATRADKHIDSNATNAVIQPNSVNPSWKRDMLKIARKHFKMSDEAAEAWILTLQAPSTPTSSSQLPADTDTGQGNFIYGADLIPNTSVKRPLSTHQKFIRNAGLPPGLSATSQQANGSLESKNPSVPPRTNEYFVPNSGIDREVITADIQRYLGGDATVRPGKYQNPTTGEIKAGYYILAYRNLTTAMIEDLKADSLRWDIERRNLAAKAPLVVNVPRGSGYDPHNHTPKASREASSGVQPTSAHATVFYDREYTGATVSGYPQSVAGYAQPKGYPIQNNYYVSGAGLVAPTAIPSAQARYAAPQDRYYSDSARFPSSFSSRTQEAGPTQADSRSSQLWWQADLRLQSRNPEISNSFYRRWKVAVNPVWNHSSPPSDYLIFDQQGANLQADNLLAVLALADDIFSAENTEKQQHELNHQVIDSVITISSIVRVVKETLEFKVGALVWILFCGVLAEIVQEDQKNDTARADAVLPHMAEIATVIARYNVMENIYIGSPNMTLDPALRDSLIEMSVLVLTYIYFVGEYKSSYTASTYTEGVESILGQLSRNMEEIRVADYRCRQFSMRGFGGALDDGAGYSSGEEDEEEERNDEYNIPLSRKRLKLS